MPKENLIKQIVTSYDNLASLNIEAFKQEPGNYQPWNNLEISDLIDSYQDSISILEKVINEDILLKLPWNILNGLPGVINNAFQHCQQLFNAPGQQAHFQNAIQHLENLRTNMTSWGLYYYAHIGKELEEKSQLIDTEIQKLLSNNKEIESIKENVRSLIEPAVAGSLSKSFSDRKSDLHKNQNRWFWVTVILAFICVTATIVIVSSVVGLFTNEKIIEIAGELIKKNGNGSVFIPIIVLRIAILIPIYSIFAFSFIQYKKERNLEEEYAHKYAVATSLPNYGDLAVDDKVKDQILSEASQVIFVSPNKLESTKTKGSTKELLQLNDLLKNLHKLIPTSGK